MAKITMKAVDEKIANYDEIAEKAAEIPDPILQKRVKMAAEHRSGAYTRIASLEDKTSRAHALSVLSRAERDLSGNDAKKIASLARVVADGDIDKMNAGFYKALIGLDKLVRKSPDKVDFSMTALRTKIELKCNVRTSLTLLAKTTFLTQIKDGREIVGYSIADREGLNGLLSIFK